MLVADRAGWRRRDLGERQNVEVLLDRLGDATVVVIAERPSERRFQVPSRIESTGCGGGGGVTAVASAAGTAAAGATAGTGATGAGAAAAGAAACVAGLGTSAIGVGDGAAVARAVATSGWALQRAMMSSSALTVGSRAHASQDAVPTRAQRLAERARAEVVLLAGLGRDHQLAGANPGLRRQGLEADRTRRQLEDQRQSVRARRHLEVGRIEGAAPPRLSVDAAHDDAPDVNDRDALGCARLALVQPARAARQRGGSCEAGDAAVHGRGLYATGRLTGKLGGRRSVGATPARSRVGTGRVL